MPDLSATATQMTAAVESWVTSEVRPHVVDWDRQDILPEPALAFLGELGIPGALVPTEYGGPEVSVAAMVDVWRALARGWISLTGAVNTTHLGTALLLRYGTEAQRARWLPGIASGAVWSSFSITEPQAGSDLRRLETTIEMSDPGLTIDGSKRWIAGGGSFGLTFMLANDPEAGRPSCVVLPSNGRGGLGWQVEMLDKIGYRGVESAAWRFEHFSAPDAEVLGGDAGRGHGARQMLDVLAIGRVNVACRALGIIDRSLSCALDQATGREIGDGELGDYSHAQLRLGEMRVRQQTTEAIIRAAAASVDAAASEAGELSVAAKVSASDAAIAAVDAASRLAASRSYTWDAELARLRRDAPQTQIGEGANDALLLAIGRELIRAREAGEGRPDEA